jgi:CubicO group peptidase (beta-lactamase class C family)
VFIIDEFEKQIEKDLRDDNVNGTISAAIVRRDETIWAKAFGSANRNGNRAADTKTIYRAASIAKSFTAFLMMLMVQDGTIALDQPVEEHLPEIRELEEYSDSTKITFHQLASHTAGLIREPKLEKADAGPIEEWQSKVLQSILKTSFESKPGERLSDSNIGYAILGVALSRAGNKPFLQLVEERIFQPLHLDNSFYVVPEHKRQNLAQGLGGGPFGDTEINLEGPENEHRGRGYKVPNGGLYSTPSDLAKFIMCNLGYAPLLDGKHLDLMHNNQTPETSYHSYGLGFELYKDPFIHIAGHAGSVWGYTSYFGFEKECHYGTVIRRNYNWGITSWNFVPKVLLRKLMDFEKKRM